MIDKKRFSDNISMLCRGALAMVLGVCMFQAAADSYEKISEWPGTMRGEPFDMKAQGDYLYASMNGQGILNVMAAGTVDLTMVSQLQLESSYCYGIYIEGNTLYLGQTNGIQLVDISDPRNLKLKERWELGYYETNSTTGQLATEKSYYSVIDLHKKGNLFYLSTGGPGFITMDLTDPANPRQLGSYDPYGSYLQMMDVSPDGNIAYVVSTTDYASAPNGTNHVHVLDVSNPYNPTKIWNDPSPLNNQRAAGISLIDNRLYIPTYFRMGSSSAVWDSYGMLGVMDAADPAHLTLAKDNWYYGWDFYHFFPVLGGAGWQAWGYLIQWDDLGYGRGYANLFGLWDDPLTPVPLREPINMTGSCYAVAFKDHYAFVADELRGCEVMDLSDPEDPVLVTTMFFPGAVRQVKVMGDILYAAAGDAGLYIIDVSNPEAPVQLANYASKLYMPSSWGTFYGSVCDFVIEGNTVFLGVNLESLFDSNTCVEIIDISDLSNISFLGYGSTYGSCEGIAKYNDTVLLSGTGNYVSMDVSFLHQGSAYTNAVYKGHFTVPGGGGKVLIPNETAPVGFISAGTSGLLTVNFADPANTGSPSELLATNTVTSLANLSLNGYRSGLSYKNGQVLVGSYYRGAARVDVTNPLQPLLLEEYLLPGNTRNAYFTEDNSLIVAARSESGLGIFQKQQTPLVPARIVYWDYTTGGNFVMLLSHVSGNLTVERSPDALHWETEPSAIINGTQIVIPAAAIAGRPVDYFRVRQWQ
ncbi:MAG: hypothetical protein IJU47_07010 [Verrucomicrobia bacterium]|nr:hypothetical protein [Verrucomicrobiota bacterium]